MLGHPAAVLLERCFEELNAGDGAGPPDTAVVLREGAALMCHGQLLQARCPGLDTETSVEVCETRAVAKELLRWVYTGKMNPLEDHEDLSRAVIAAELWGLRDMNAMRQRLLRSWRKEPAKGCVEADLLRAYDQERLGTTRFLCDVVDGEDPHVYAGFLPLLIKASSFFSALFSHRWARAQPDADAAVVKVGWDASTLRRLLRFLHGGPSFVRNVHDLEQALHLADFFEMPLLLAHCNTWIVEHLDRESAPRLWSYVESQPRLCLDWLEDPIFREDMQITADSECYEFLLREFPLMLEGILDGENWVPLYDLTLSLMYRLVASGSLNVSTALLKSVITKFVEHKVPQDQQKAVLKTLMPPQVLFNRELRDQVLGAVRGGISSLL